MDFSKFDKAISKEQLKDIEEAKANGGGNYPEVPKGNYSVKFEKLEIGETGANSVGGAGRPMLKVAARIQEGEYKKQMIFMNRVLYGTKNDAGMIGSALAFLQKLDPEADDIVFESYSQLAELVLDIYECISTEKFAVEYDPKAFNTISIDNIPF